MDELKEKLLKLLEDDEEFRNRVASLLGLSDMSMKVDRLEKSQNKLWEGFVNLREGQRKLWEVQRKMWRR